MVAARLGVKPTVLIGLVGVALTTALFGLATTAWQLDVARFAQGLSSSFSWTGSLAWLVAVSSRDRRGQVIGRAFAAAVAGALLGPVLGGVATLTGTGWAFGARGRGLARPRGVGAAHACGAPGGAAAAPDARRRAP